MSKRPAVPVLALGFAVLVVTHLASCRRSDEPFRKETIPVTGQVLVDGQPPDSPLQVLCHDLKGMDPEHPTVSQTTTADEGRFAISTYESGDGVPPGDYVLTFAWQPFNTFSMSYSGPDKLNGCYNDPQKSDVKLSVESGDEPIDLGRIELTTK